MGVGEEHGPAGLPDLPPGASGVIASAWPRKVDATRPDDTGAVSDHLFPRYHVRPPSGYVNDPNGPVLLDGVVHLYHQSRDTLDLASPVHWGHATSTDLAHWTNHPPAVVPHPGHGDRDGCWSGNTVVDDAGRLRAFYSGHVDGEPLQRTLCAVSDDGGHTFGTPRQVLPPPAPEDGIRVLRDPFVWRSGSSWRMVVGAGTDAETALARLYTSADLDAWSYAGPLLAMPRTRTAAWDSGAMWECPQVLTLDGVDVAVVGTWEAAGVMDVLSVIVPPAGPVDPPAPRLVDHGPNFYAASVLRESPHGPVMWGWATEGRTADRCREDGWSGMLTLPRAVALRPDGALASTPVPGLAGLRVEPAGRDVPDHLDGLGAQLEFLLRGPGAIRLCCGPGEYLEVAVDAAGRVTVDRDHASTDPGADRGVVVVDGAGPPSGDVRGYVDGSILELFLPGGEVATVRFYPTGPPPWRLERVGSARLSVWELAG